MTLHPSACSAFTALAYPAISSVPAPNGAQKSSAAAGAIPCTSWAMARPSSVSSAASLPSCSTFTPAAGRYPLSTSDLAPPS